MQQSTKADNHPYQMFGKAKLFTQPFTGDSRVPLAAYRGSKILDQAVPTNQWYSSVMYQPFAEIIYAIPLAIKPTQNGFEMSLTLKKMLYPKNNVEIHYPHTQDLIISSHQQQANQAVLADFSDWSADIELNYPNANLTASVAHGSPFVYYSLSTGQISLSIEPSFNIQVKRNQLHIRTPTKYYIAYAMAESTWQNLAPNRWLIDAAAVNQYLSIAAVPDDSPTTLQQFSDSAHSFIRRTNSSFEIDPQTQQITTHFAIDSRSPDGAANQDPIIGLYPHHYHQNSSLPEAIGELDSIRGVIKLYRLSAFKTQYHHRAFTPIWPAATDPKQQKILTTQLKRDTKRARRMLLEIGQGPYWQGKGLQRITQLMNVAYANHQTEMVDKLLKTTQRRAESWFNGDSKRTYFMLDEQTGTVVSYPEEYDAVKDMNDHHFHYGYWIRAAAEIGLHDPSWLEQQSWGAILDLLIKDIATYQRQRQDFPWLRNFDVYEGHSWASGVARGAFGNNQESSSEAINAWAGIMLYGAVTNQPDLVALGQYLYNTEISAVQYYWFDVHGLTFPEEYFHQQASILFAAKTVHYTWWTDEPRQTHGINLLPITQSSTYLGEYPDFVVANLASLEKNIEAYNDESLIDKFLKPPSYLPRDIWQDLFAKYLALVDTPKAQQTYQLWGDFELGETRSNAINWITLLEQMGTPKLNISSDYPFTAVFEKQDSKTYLAYNFSNQAKTVRFSDGVQLDLTTKGLHHIIR